MKQIVAIILFTIFISLTGTALATSLTQIMTRLVPELALSWGYEYHNAQPLVLCGFQ